MEIIQHYSKIILDNIKKYEFEEAPYELYHPINYIIANGGKRLRPILTLMATKAFGGDIETAVKPALAIEFFHNFTLIHDDIMDDAPLRRGKATVHTLYGTNVGILSGDALLIKSYQFFEDLEANLFKKCLLTFSETGIKICEGQQQDVNFEKMENISYEDYFQMITYKTAVLCAAALQIGAFIADASEKNATAMYDFGINLGIAFQMMDDYLDVFGNQKDFGKKIAGDIYENKKTILYISALKNATEEQKNELLKWYAQKDESEEKVNAVISLFKATNADKEVLGLVEHYHRLALENLNESDLNDEQKKSFIALSEYLLNRNI